MIGCIRRWSRYTGHRHRSSVAVTYVSCSFPPWIVIGNDFRHRYTLPKYFYPTPTETEYLEIWIFLTLYLLFLFFHYEKSWIENYTLLLYIQYFQLFLWIKVKDRFQRGNYEVELNRELEGRGIFSRSEFYRFITQWTIYSTFIHGMRQISKRVYSCR